MVVFNLSGPLWSVVVTREYFEDLGSQIAMVLADLGPLVDATNFGNPAQSVVRFSGIGMLSFQK